MELNLESIMSNNYFKPLIVILAWSIVEICHVECVFLFKTWHDVGHWFIFLQLSLHKTRKINNLNSKSTKTQTPRLSMPTWVSICSCWRSLLALWCIVLHCGLCCHYGDGFFWLLPQDSGQKISQPSSKM